MTHKSRDEYWEKIFSEIDMDFIPLEYINSVIVTFHDGKEWEIDVKKSIESTTDVETVLDDFFKEYQDTIETVDFRLDTRRLQRDVGKRTRRFLKVNK